MVPPWSASSGWSPRASVERSPGILRFPPGLPTYGSLLVDAERMLDELERAEAVLAVSTP